MFHSRVANILHLTSKAKLIQQSARCSALPTTTSICVARKSTSTTTTNVTAANGDFLLEPAHIEEAIRLAPTLTKITPDQWQRQHATFVNHGFNTSNFLRIVTGNPAVLSRPSQKIVESIENWRSCQFGENLLFLLITKYPELLDVTDRRRTLTHITFLKGFVGRGKYVWLLLMNCPNVLQQTERCILQKLDYLQYTMRIDVPEIVKCGALGHPLAELRCRHMFLHRLGLFTPRSPKAEEHEPTKNPRLHKIIDTSEKAFATKVCHVTLAEFEAFRNLYARECRKLDDESNEDDDNDGEENDEAEFSSVDK